MVCNIQDLKKKGNMVEDKLIKKFNSSVYFQREGHNRAV